MNLDRLNTTHSTIISGELTTFSSNDLVKKKTYYFLSIVKFLGSSFKVFDSDVNFLIYLVDGIANRTPARICLYKLDDAFSDKTQMDVIRLGEYRQYFIFMRANCNSSTINCSFERMLRFALSPRFFSFCTHKVTSSEIFKLGQLLHNYIMLLDTPIFQ